VDIVLYPLERPTESRLSVEGKRRLGEFSASSSKTSRPSDGHRGRAITFAHPPAAANT